LDLFLRQFIFRICFRPYKHVEIKFEHLFGFSRLRFSIHNLSEQSDISEIDDKVALQNFVMMNVLVYLSLLQISFVLSEGNSSSLLSIASKEGISIAQSNVKQGRNRASGPQSLTLLMNFKDDGTTSFQIMQGKHSKHE
jgi:hypothetical protein